MVRTAIIVTTRRAFTAEVLTVLKQERPEPEEAMMPRPQADSAIEIHQCHSYAEAVIALQGNNIQAVIVDTQTMSADSQEFFDQAVLQYDETWFLAVGDDAPYNKDVVQIIPPLDSGKFDFFLRQRRVSERFGKKVEQFWGEESMRPIHAILMEHLTTGILNGWVSNERSMIMSAAYGVHIPGLENWPMIPILAKVSCTEQDIELRVGESHRYFKDLFIRSFRLGVDRGVVSSIENKKWLILLYHDKLHIREEDLLHLCWSTVEEAKRAGWMLSLYVGDIVLLETLQDEWKALEGISDQDVGYSPQVIQARKTLVHQVADIPDMSEWHMKMNDGHYDQILGLIETYVVNLARCNQVDVTWLDSFYYSFLQILFQSMQHHRIPVAEVLRNTRHNSFHSMQEMFSRIDAVLGRCDSFLKAERKSNVIIQTQEYIKSNLDQELDRDAIAAHIFVSGGYLGRKFKQEVHMTLAEYVYSERMKLAATMLEQTSWSVTTIAVNVGYTNLAYFSTQFKLYSGVSPQEYRKQF